MNSLAGGKVEKTVTVARHPHSFCFTVTEPEPGLSLPARTLRPAGHWPARLRRRCTPRSATGRPTGVQPRAGAGSHTTVVCRCSEPTVRVALSVAYPPQEHTLEQRTPRPHLTHHPPLSLIFSSLFSHTLHKSHFQAENLRNRSAHPSGSPPLPFFRC